MVKVCHFYFRITKCNRVIDTSFSSASEREFYAEPVIKNTTRDIKLFGLLYTIKKQNNRRNQLNMLKLFLNCPFSENKFSSLPLTLLV